MHAHMCAHVNPRVQETDGWDLLWLFDAQRAAAEGASEDVEGAGEGASEDVEGAMRAF
jgi:hypothetical protein